MTVSADDSAPAYLQLVRHLRRQITSGELRTGDRLPSRGELARSFGVSTNTVLAAIRVLRSEGLVRGQQGRGTFVRSPAARQAREQGSADYEHLMSQIEQFADDLQQMRHRLERLEQAAGLAPGQGDTAP